MKDRVTQLAFQIADDAARCDIEMLCGTVGGEPRSVEEMRTCWYDLNLLRDSTDVPHVRAAAEYLDCRGMLMRHPERRDWVRPRNVAEAP